MNNNKNKYLLAALMTGFGFLTVWQIQTIAKPGHKAIQVSVITEKDSFALGEIIGLRFTIKNVSGESFVIFRPSTRTGNLRLYISNDRQNYAQYVGPNWGALDVKAGQMTLGDGESLDATATLLHNQPTATEHLTALYANRIRKEHVGTEFAYEEAGHYWMMAVFTDGKEIYRSAPVEIDVTEPVGTDAAVWEQIKTDGAFAYFLQTGNLKYQAGSDEAQDFIEKLKHITTDYPSTNFSRRLNEHLTKYDKNLETVRKLSVDLQ